MSKLFVTASLFLAALAGPSFADGMPDARPRARAKQAASKVSAKGASTRRAPAKPKPVDPKNRRTV